ncbi:MAG: hypothetical protein JNJ43_12870 [Anaerolineales bacterium]|nr:hypothetical protein [Anaerolineales bacterium]
MKSESNKITTDMDVEEKVAKSSLNRLIAWATVLGFLIIFIGVFIEKYDVPSVVNDVLFAIGTSIIASVIFYILYSRTAEKQVLSEISISTTKSAILFSYKEFQERFARQLPLKTYPKTDKPSKEFNDDFDRYLRESKIFFFKSDSAGYLSYRLNKLSKQGLIASKEVKIMIADPREVHVFESDLRMSLKNNQDIKKNSQDNDLLGNLEISAFTNKIQGLRKEVYITLVALFDIKHLAKTEVYLHKEYPFFRAEIFDGAIFLNYVLGGEYPSTYLYPNTTYIYDAYYLNFKQNFNPPLINIVFDKKLTDNKFLKILKTLGCKHSIENLRKGKDERFEKYHKEESSEK